MALPKLNLRDLFWIVLVVGLVLGWWAQYQHTRRLATTVTDLKADNESLMDLIAKIEAEQMRMDMGLGPQRGARNALLRP